MKKQQCLDEINHLKSLLENRDAYISQIEKNNEALVSYAKNIRSAKFASKIILEEQVKIEYLLE
jgi:hypothetical protein